MLNLSPTLKQIPLNHAKLSAFNGTMKNIKYRISNFEKMKCEIRKPLEIGHVKKAVFFLWLFGNSKFEMLNSLKFHHKCDAAVVIIERR